MEPVLHDGHLYCMCTTPYRDTQATMILAYTNQVWGENVCHRAVRGHLNRWVMQGDASSKTDPGYCTAANYLFEVLPIERVAVVLPLTGASVSAVLRPIPLTTVSSPLQLFLPPSRSRSLYRFSSHE